ncbi:hypothetical protein PP175_27225 (plasmid) [Aneurinibacillus sp. Ricciae_BoGa-3]|uniref:hypothetical protein n=1 Tax=Aneurinibacillus sp. Ricciae_BoGa-3 TaxID=3022697 RepID=UPI00234095CB|nr:hypothetical protein [Aneurinibacillus sp. Ricciae_BoGa-3]WCK57730.1 hypothetical protein PP175_27225 [Aneurinibacillus sp. Ricciae_BoGa-3]
MIGRMYRPLKILTIPGKRGYNILNKYKSSFGGEADTFEMEVYLHYNAGKGTEEVRIEFKDLTLPVRIENGHRISAHVASNTDAERKIGSLRKFERPTNITSKNVLEFTMLIKSQKDEEENDALVVRLNPTVIDNEEYMVVEAECETPVVVKGTKKVSVGE